MSEPTTPTTIQIPTPVIDRELEKQKNAIRKKVIERTFLQAHIAIYIIVNLLLYAIYTYVANNGSNWYLWSATGWGLALLIHIFTYIAKSAGLLSYHIYIYVIVNIYLAFIDIFTDGEFNWVWWPIGGWAIGLILHVVLYLIYKPRKHEDPTKSWMDRKIEAELQAVKKTVTAAPANPNEPFCKKCGKPNLKDAEFCAHCGERM